MADEPNASGNDTPGAGNVSDGTQPVSSPATSNVTNDDAASTPANTQRHDTPGGQGFDLTKLLDRIDALPETIANAVKELTPQTQTSSPTPDNSNNSTAGNGTADNGVSGVSTDNGGKRSRSDRFASWWTGR